MMREKMEDWGLVSYREPLLLFNPNFGRTIDVDNIIRIIAHEFMHQFIGNMVITITKNEIICLIFTICLGFTRMVVLYRKYFLNY